MAETSAGPTEPLDVRTIHYLVRLMKRYDLTAIDLTEGPVQIRLRRRGPELGPPAASAIPHGAGGTYPALYTGAAAPPSRARRRPSRRLRRPRDDRHREPDGRDLLRLQRAGRPSVRHGRLRGPSGPTVCIIEAMKVFTDIPAGVSGTIAEVLVKNGQPVEFGQPLFRVKPVVNDRAAERPGP